MLKQQKKKGKGKKESGNCFLSRSLATDGQDGHGLKIGKIGLSFSLNASPKKIFLASAP